MTVAMAAAELGVSTTSVQSAISRGRLPARKMGPIWVIGRADLDAYRASVAHKGKPGPKPAGGKRRPPVPGTGPGTGPGHPAGASGQW
jgi:excisionase family DNA binding protein